MCACVRGTSVCLHVCMLSEERESVCMYGEGDVGGGGRQCVQVERDMTCSGVGEGSKCICYAREEGQGRG